jgi:hypothetical protein
VLAASFFIGTVIVVLMNLNITTSPPDIPEGTPLPDGLFAEFANAREGWPQEVANGLLFALGFLAIAILGPILRHSLDKHDPRAYRVAVFLLVAGTIGVISQIVPLAIRDAAIVPYYCDCNFKDPQLISRGALVDASFSVGSWLTDAFVVLYALGLWAIAGLARRAEWPSSFVLWSQLLAVVGVVSVAWDRLVARWLMDAQVQLEYGYIQLGFLVLLAGIGVPVWAWMLSRILSPRVQISDA